MNVTVDGDANGSITNMDGLYEIFVTKKSVVLKFTYIGFKTSEIRTNASTNIYDVTLEEQVNELEETVIVGYGTQRKISNIGAQSSMKMEDIKTPSASLTTTLAGRLAGVVAVQRTGEPGKMLLISGFVVFPLPTLLLRWYWWMEWNVRSMTSIRKILNR